MKNRLSVEANTYVMSFGDSPCVIGFRRAADLDRLRAGEVLVCPITTAAWMMSFQRAGALVADAGSVLSHTAIVAREYGLPAVVATANGTATLVDGEEVTVDGNRGTVERVVKS